MTTYTTADVNGQTMPFAVALRDGNDTPVAMHFTMRVPVSFEDLTAALWVALLGGLSLYDLADDEFLADTAFQTLLAESAADITDARLMLEELTPADDQYAAARATRRRVHEVFGPLLTPRQRDREPVGVAL